MTNNVVSIFLFYFFAFLRCRWPESCARPLKPSSRYSLFVPRFFCSISISSNLRVVWQAFPSHLCVPGDGPWVRNVNKQRFGVTKQSFVGAGFLFHIPDYGVTLWQ